MTARVRTLTVVLDQDIRTDDLEPIIAAIHMIRHVYSVSPSDIATNDWTARAVLASQVRRKLYEAIDAAFSPDKKGL